MSEGTSPYGLDPRDVTLPAGHLWRRMPAIGLALGVLGTAAAYWLGGADHHRQFYFSWLVAFAFFLSLALGGLFVVIAHFASKAGWSVVVRRAAENAMATLPLFALLFVPVLLGAHGLFHWTHEEAVAKDHLLQAKSGYLNMPFFTIRAVAYFVIWGLLAWWFGRQSRAQDKSGAHALTRRMQWMSGPALILFALTASLAAIDWLMSLDPHWYSTIFGVYFFSGAVVGVYAFLILVLGSVRGVGRMRGVVTVEHLHDLGKLLFAVTVFWTYIALSQFFLIWYGNIPEETLWYLHRYEGSWLSVTRLLAVGHFAIPFLFLMSHKIKRKPALLFSGAVWMLVMHYIDLYWLVMPVLHPESAQFGPTDVAALLGVGGFFLAGFGLTLGRSPLVPVRDPRLPESLGFENV